MSSRHKFYFTYCFHHRMEQNKRNIVWKKRHEWYWIGHMWFVCRKKHTHGFIYHLKRFICFVFEFFAQRISPFNRINETHCHQQCYPFEAELYIVACQCWILSRILNMLITFPSHIKIKCLSVASLSSTDYVIHMHI